MPAAMPICVLGGGLIGIRHIEVIEQSPKAQLVMVIEPDPERRATLAEMGLPVGAEVADVPRGCEIAVVATPTPDHHHSVLALFDRGLGILVEKPVAGTLRQAQMILSAAQKTGLPLIVGHHRRCQPFVAKARALLPDLGAAIAVQGMWVARKNDAYYTPDWRRNPGAGPLMTNLSHEIDLLQFLFGPISQISALVSNAARGLNVEDSATLAIRFESGVLGSFIISDAGASPWSFEASSAENPNVAGSNEDYIKISGTQGAMAFPSLTTWQQTATGEVEWSKPLIAHRPAALPKIDPILHQIERCIDHIGGKADAHLCTGEEGLSALRWTLAATLSAQLGRPVSAGDVPLDFDGTDTGATPSPLQKEA